MPNKMLIDASHPEETRVVVMRGNRVEEFDFESASKKQLRGNIYLAKVTRVEPSLQAAFVDYGGNRHGFLAFSEIHPEYYHIPVADRQALLEEDARAQRAEEESETRSGPRRGRSRRHDEGEVAQRRSDEADETISEPLVGETAAALASEHPAPPIDEDSDLPVVIPVVDDAAALPAETAEQATPGLDTSEAGKALAEAAPPEETAVSAEAAFDRSDAPDEAIFGESDADVVPTSIAQPVKVEERQDTESRGEEPDQADERRDDRVAAEEEEDSEAESDSQVVEQIGGDAMEEIPHRPARPRRQYKIQEVIKRRQVLLVQVAKEERGTKGAALTTYLSLAGRYSVLMPNTARGGGISRKITSAVDRKRLKAIAEELEVPEGMGIILRTAGATRTKAEVKRDFEYLLRMWEQVREVTLRSTAPTLVYEEGSLIKRAIRDLYSKDIDEIIVAGEDGYREAKEFMRMLMPSHAKNVKLYRDVQPIFARAGAEAQLDAMFTNQVTLRSGGYIVMNQTEALVAIDVNSGRSTREHNIEDTALRTNLEAADEVARQLRLRDLAGLIVVDFIDMEETRNNRAVERRMKEALKNDRARIQIGRISHFGLLEMSRQRIRTGVLEGSTILCPHCMGAGMVRSTASIALHVLRGLEEALIKNAQHNVTVRTRTEVALYILNQKRSHLRELETRFGVTISVAADASLTGISYYTIERGEPATPQAELRRSELVRIDTVQPAYEDETIETIEPEEDEEGVPAGEDEAFLEDEPVEGAQEGHAGESSDGRGIDGDAVRRRRRRRRRRGRDRDNRALVNPDAPQPSDDGLAIVGDIDGVARLEHAEPAESSSRHRPFAGEPEEFGEAPLQTEMPAAPEAQSEIADEQPHRRSRRHEPRARRQYAELTAPPEGNLHTREAADGGFVESDGQPPAPTPDEATTEPAAPPEPSRESGAEVSAAASAAEAPPSAAAFEPATAPPRRTDHGGEAATAEPGEAPLPPSETEPTPEEPARPKKSGWWQRARATFGN
ncbi:MAG: Rne/Rng family ribonuclease [Methylobacteriaceae bacterium]|nr:Rne/Rng family ribonuclease [Methylobacteriaceae bacterium]